MRDVKVLDGWALLAYFEGERRGQKVTQILAESAGKKNNLLIAAVNWGEILYIIESRYNRSKRDEMERLMGQMYIVVVPVGRDLAREAAHLKANFKLPYADCFAAALTKLEKGELVTGDDDFKCVEKKIRILWL